MNHDVCELEAELLFCLESRCVAITWGSYTFSPLTQQCVDTVCLYTTQKSANT